MNLGAGSEWDMANTDERVGGTRGAVAGNRSPAGVSLPGGQGPGLLSIATFTMSADGLITSWSAAAQRLFGRAAAEVVGSPLAVLLEPGHEPVLAGGLAAMRDGRDCWTGSVAATGPDGRQAVALRWDLLRGGGPPQVAVAARRLAPAWAEPFGGADARLGASLDLAETALQVLELAIPRFADAGAVYLLEPLLAAGRAGAGDSTSGLVARRLTIQAADGSHQRWLDVLPEGEVVVFPAGTPAWDCAAAGRTVLFEQPDAGMRERAGRYSGEQILARYGSFLVTPLTARGGVAGLLLLARVAGAQRFGTLEVTAAEALAIRAGTCVDNARLYTQERLTAQALQRGLLPGLLATPAGLDVAHRYRPAGDQAVGGDWFDVLPLSGGRVAVTVGDAMGHGPEAAAVMAQLRAAAHALADLELPPDQLLHRLNRMAATVSEGTFATCVCAVVDPVARSCQLARAGHLPPLLTVPGESCAVVELAPGLPLGLAEATFQSAEIMLPPGAVLALYTDGLVESRARPFDVGIEALRGTLERVRGPLPDACDSIITELGQHGEDDTTLVLVRLPGAAARQARDGSLTGVG